MATTTQAKYDAAVAKYWKLKTDAIMQREWVTVIPDQKSTTSWWTIVATKVDQKLPTVYEWTWILTKIVNAWLNIWKKAKDIVAAKALAAKALAAKRKREYEASAKKAWWSENLLKQAEIKYWVNSPEYIKIRNKVNKYEWWPSTIRSTTIENKTPPVESTTDKLTLTKYNSLLNKYWNADAVIAATKAQYWENSTEAKKMAELINKYIWANNAKQIREQTVITDSSKRTWEGVTITKKEETPTVWKNLWTKDLSKESTLRDKLKESEKISTAESEEKLRQYRLSWKSDADLLKKAETKYWKDSEEYKKLKTYIDNNPLPSWTEWVWTELLWKTKEELDEAKITSLTSMRDENIAKTAENFIKWSEIIAWNNEKLQEFYKQMATELKQQIDDNKALRQKALERTKNTELNRVVWQIRATLARRWINIWNIPPEQLIALSWELWVEAMRKIDEATTEMEQSIADFTDKKAAEINKYLEQWLIKQWEADASIEQMRQLKEKMIQDIKSSFIANTFQIAEASISDADKNKAEVLNTISKFVTQLWLSWTAQWVMENYLQAWDSVEALQNMIADLNDVNSELYKKVADAEKAAQLAAEFKAKIELMKATKSSSSWTSAKSELSSVQKAALVNNWYNPNNYPTFASVIELAKNDPDLKLALSKSAITVAE